MVYLSGALGAEMVSGLVASLAGYENMPFRIISTFEETLEMTGSVLFLRAILLYLGSGFQVALELEELPGGRLAKPFAAHPDREFAPRMESEPVRRTS